jgi:tRNA nucleotidyltransferase (CCA-adding enzyme)
MQSNPKIVFSRVLSRIKPSKEESRRNFEAAYRLIAKLENVVPSSVKVVLGGSLAKGTNLAGSNEFDIFLLFPRHYQHHEMALLGMRYAKTAFAGMRTESRYAEHPYLQVFAGNCRADVVPAYKIKDISEKGSSVDRTQLHTQYVNANLGPEGKDEVRLLKQFMKSLGIYGAELRVEGFSGYLCELLIIKYGSLLSLMQEASRWENPAIVIGGDAEAEKKAREKFASPLVVIDPVDPGRNVAAVVSQTSLSRFIFECRRFLKNPSEKFFFMEKKAASLAKIRAAIGARKTSCLLLSFPAPHAVPDIVWPQLKKAAQAFVRELEAMGFSVFGYYHWSDGNECAIFIELGCWKLPAVKKAVGPSVKFARDVDAFAEKHKHAINIHIEHDRIVAIEKRKVTDCVQGIRLVSKNGKKAGVPENMLKSMQRGLKILQGKGIAKKKYAWFLTDYFFTKIA